MIDSLKTDRAFIEALHIPLFPIEWKDGRSKPVSTGWQESAGVCRGDVRDVGVLTTGLLVLDLDVKNGKDGLASLSEIEDIYGQLPETLTVETPSGGRHLYFSAPPDGVPCSVSKIANGIDVRGNGGFVVAPGSVRPDGKTYKIVNAAPIANPPAFLVNLAGKPAFKALNRAPVVELDKPEYLNHAEEIIAAAPEEILGQRNQQLFLLGCKIKDNGVSYGECLTLIAEEYPTSLDLPEIEKTLTSCYANSQDPPGSKAMATAADFRPIPGYLPPEPLKTRPKLYYFKAEDAALNLKQSYLIKGVIDKGALAILYGESNVGKTFVALDMAYALACNVDWFGHKTAERQAVIYVATEGGRAIQNRVIALRKKYGRDGAPFYVVPCPVDLMHPNGDIAELINLIRQIAEENNVSVGLIVVDTLSRALAGGNENDSADMGAFVINLDKVRIAINAAVLIVHHTGKDKAKGARGHSLLRAAVDTELECDGTGGNGEIRATKQREMAEMPPILFKLAVVKLGVDADGDDVTTCVVERRMFVAVRPEDDLEPRARVALEALKELSVISGAGRRTAVRQDTWRDECKARATGEGPSAGFSIGKYFYQEFRQAVKALEEADLTRKIGDNWQLNLS